MMQAFSGQWASQGTGAGSVRIGVSFIDMATGIAAYGAILTALFERERTGRNLGATVASRDGRGVARPSRGNGSRPACSRRDPAAGNLSPYQAFECSDGYLVVGATNDRVFAKLCEALGQRGVDRFALPPMLCRVTHRTALNEILFPRFATASSVAWADQLEAAGVPASPVNSVDQVMAHPQVMANDMIVEVDTSDGATARYAGTPFKIEGHDGPSRRAALHKGADTSYILGDVLGFRQRTSSAPCVPERRCMVDEDPIVGRESGVSRCFLNRPARLNAITAPMFESLLERFSRIAADEKRWTPRAGGAGAPLRGRRRHRDGRS